jgi:hypothetical protein
MMCRRVVVNVLQLQSMIDEIRGIATTLQSAIVTIGFICENVFT